MDIRKILTDASDEKSTVEDLLSIAILPITLFKTSQDTTVFLSELKKLIIPNYTIDDQIIDKNITYLMKRAGFVYPTASVKITNYYYTTDNENKIDSNILMTHFTNSLYYIHKKIYSETNDNSIPLRKIKNAMNFFDSMLIKNAEDYVKIGLETISRYNGTKNKVAQYKEMKIAVLKNINEKKQANKNIINATAQNATAQNATAQNATAQNATAQNATAQNATAQTSVKVKNTQEEIKAANHKNKIIGQTIGVFMICTHTIYEIKNEDYNYLANKIKEIFKTDYNDNITENARKIEDLAVYICEKNHGKYPSEKKSWGEKSDGSDGINYDEDTIIREVAKFKIKLNKDLSKDDLVKEMREINSYLVYGLDSVNVREIVEDVLDNKLKEDIVKATKNEEGLLSKIKNIIKFNKQ